jgi:hypothetical protein
MEGLTQIVFTEANLTLSFALHAIEPGTARHPATRE